MADRISSARFPEPQSQVGGWPAGSLPGLLGPPAQGAPYGDSGMALQAVPGTDGCTTPPFLLCKSRSSQATLVPKEHKTFMEEAYSAAICFKMLRDLNSSDPLHLKYIIKKIKNVAHGDPNLVPDTIHDYFVDNLEISAWHKFRLFHVLEAVIGASESLEETWEKTFMQLALENMTKTTELEEAHRDAASNVLVAICRHVWRLVAQHLETEVLSGVFPPRSVLYVMGILTSNALRQQAWTESGRSEEAQEAGLPCHVGLSPDHRQTEAKLTEAVRRAWVTQPHVLGLRGPGLRVSAAAAASEPLEGPPG
ncbi:hypothetical protein J1605_013906 [Eschrichtius robustus]|uniref:MROH2B-like N-terminal HEAT-repeats domain-containing protein n=1 Tax=Eschrichtius robustus TaxID=9764 RepID=A0AB34GDL7_ESCRO|nr:hypothetical protein J1605_013906 [Eschrichtius robustus]